MAMTCPDCKDGFYYPLVGPREPCQTCGSLRIVSDKHKATVTVEKIPANLHKMSGLPVFNPCPQCQWPVQQGKTCPNCTKVPDVSELICESRISASKSYVPIEVLSAVGVLGMYNIQDLEWEFNLNGDWKITKAQLPEHYETLVTVFRHLRTTVSAAPIYDLLVQIVDMIQIIMPKQSLTHLADALGEQRGWLLKMRENHTGRRDWIRKMREAAHGET